jgi:hypothetical protein
MRIKSVAARKALSREERFWAKVDRYGPVPLGRPELGPCWVWTGYIRPDGYGQFGTGKQRQPHRFAYELVKGLIPSGLELDHLCHDREACVGGDSCPHRRCVNPAHLDPVDHATNLRRGLGGRNNREKAHCKHGHDFTLLNTRIERRGVLTKRVCRACDRERMRKTRARIAASPTPDG